MDHIHLSSYIKSHLYYQGMSRLEDRHPQWTYISLYFRLLSLSPPPIRHQGPCLFVYIQPRFIDSKIQVQSSYLIYSGHWIHIHDYTDDDPTIAVTDATWAKKPGEQRSVHSMTLTISPLLSTVSDILGKDKISGDWASINFGLTKMVPHAAYAAWNINEQLEQQDCGFLSCVQYIPRRTGVPQTEKNIEEVARNNDKHWDFCALQYTG